ncbi:amylo-alpha-1,6-glucosidase [Pilimelia anulata]|uniref:Amylo-alpha-1,6-glucosidase n=1 Tax=Pilimelia anulata TaxID=53371 RepID=A0A8J3B6K3_9ACTN|nr:amylo-alpha-1,6-glucosidase [Pilimelia anulata]GGJ93377.1 amylo-alpha-1,6-glucosidase [Pilimelia anulata]
MPDQTISILQGSAFVVCDRRGDFRAGADAAVGLFYRDMRHLSRWELRLNGRKLDVLSAKTIEYDEAAFFLVEPTGTIYRNPSLSVIRRREVARGMREEIELQNHGNEAVRLELSFLFDADFADIFEVKDGLNKKGMSYRVQKVDTLTLGYRRDDYVRETHLRAPGAYFTDESLTFRLSLGPNETWQGVIEVDVALEEERPLPKRAHSPDMPASLPQWLAAAPRIETDWTDLKATYRRSIIDLAALRFYPYPDRSASLPAAGLPWFMAVFGRDSLITSYQVLPFVPELARTTLRALAAQQATAVDDMRDAEPGKILHELRLGEMAHFGERPQSPYYGAADSTPLFLIVLDEYERWTGDAETVRALEHAARAAVTWIERYGDLDGDGFVEYETRNPGIGLDNQCWKDSWNSIVHPDATIARTPIATCEIQGYCYDALRRTARLARLYWNDPAYADALDADADRLRRRFDEKFWLPEHGYYALALDGDKKPVATLTSNIGHLLWSGIVPDERVGALATHLCGEQLFTGWGVRTLAEGQRPYNPIEYHNGTVWPHDTSLVAAGLYRYGRREEANRLAVGLLEAARHVGFRLPEAFAGYPRRSTEVPVIYPTACSPQAWATGAPLLLLRVMLGLEPTEETGLHVDPFLPDRIGHLAIRGVPGRWGHADAVGEHRGR